MPSALAEIHLIMFGDIALGPSGVCFAVVVVGPLISVEAPRSSVVTRPGQAPLVRGPPCGADLSRR
ncbi:hypothetical protein GCM10011579_053390 [Streptomyces albiflavescens]|uniref:Uncharacterized protein n=1 Tax=Streptomyces albiflavescens TaxID=1623582 RepID=A0A918D7B8_9ACTN|nr:hypothetical protein GCM10011579_053390 [Streptomyces albiflavescens]